MAKYYIFLVTESNKFSFLNVDVNVLIRIRFKAVFINNTIDYNIIIFINYYIIK